MQTVYSMTYDWFVNCSGLRNNWTLHSMQHPYLYPSNIAFSKASITTNNDKCENEVLITLSAALLLRKLFLRLKVRNLLVLFEAWMKWERFREGLVVETIFSGHCHVLSEVIDTEKTKTNLPFCLLKGPLSLRFFLLLLQLAKSRRNSKSDLANVLRVSVCSN